MKKRLTQKKPAQPANPNLNTAYSEMTKDKKREKEALEWAELTFRDADNETAWGLVG